MWPLLQAPMLILYRPSNAVPNWGFPSNYCAFEAQSHVYTIWRRWLHRFGEHDLTISDRTEKMTTAREWFLVAFPAHLR